MSSSEDESGLVFKDPIRSWSDDKEEERADKVRPPDPSNALFDPDEDWEAELTDRYHHMKLEEQRHEQPEEWAERMQQKRKEPKRPLAQAGSQPGNGTPRQGRNSPPSRRPIVVLRRLVVPPERAHCSKDWRYLPAPRPSPEPENRSDSETQAVLAQAPVEESEMETGE